MTETREPKGGDRSFSAPDGPRLERSRLAHWPPPFRSGQTQPKIIRHEVNEKPKLAKARGWRLTRAMLSEFSD